MDVITIKGALDPARLLSSIEKSGQETSSIYANFAYKNGRIDVVDRDYSNAFELIDVSAREYPMQDAEAIISEYIHNDLDIGKDLLFKFVLIKIDATTWLLAEYCNHILMDGWGHSLVYSRIVDIYNHTDASSAITLGHQQALNECETRYADSPAYIKDRDYWQQYCAELPPPLRMSMEDKPAESLLRFRARLVGPLEQRLRAFADTRQLRLSGLLLALFGIFLGKMSGESRFTVGMPVAARKDKAARNVPGMMANILPLEIVTGPDDTLDDVARHIGRTLRKHLVHQCYRYEDMVRDRAREGTFGALFHMTLNVVAYDQNMAFDGCEVAFQNVANGYTSDLSIDVFDRNADGSLEIGLNANGSLYTQALLAQYYDRFLLMIERVMANAEQPLRDLSLLTDEELQAHMARARRPAPVFNTVTERFAAIVQAHAERTAVSAGDASLTYGVLAQRVAAVAAQLADTGVAQGDRVGVMLPRGLDWIVSLLALYQLGATYLPINRDLPDARIRYMLDDAAVRTVIVDKAGATQTLDAQCIEWVMPAMLDGDTMHQPAALTPDTGAYIIYTSGSTGQPKGVLVPHQGIVDEVVAMQKSTRIQPGDRLMQSSAASFDVSCLEVMLGLLSGAHLVIADTQVMAGESARLKDFIATQGITHLFLTPSVLAAHPQDTLPAEVTLILTGEAASKSLLERFAHCQRVLNLYGPSEATIVTINDQFSPYDLSLGTPIDSMRTYVLDPQRRLLPPGTMGELYVAGTGLAQGYLNLPEMTEVRFLPDLFVPGEKMYATGDLVYQTLDGRLIYCRRRDDQVKLRGLRIELGEIRTALLQHPAVEEAHVAVESHPTLGATLIGYVRATSATPHDLKTHLRQTLPPYMVPSVIHTLDVLPLTPNGKLDKKRLQAQLQDPMAADASAEAAWMTPAEAILCDIFASVLQHEGPVHKDQDFFMLGGHSLLAFKVIERVRQRFDIELSIADLLSHPTPSAIATQLSHHQHTDALAPLLQLRSGEDDAPPIFCMNIGSGIGWPYVGLLPYFPAEWPVYAFQSGSLKDANYNPASIDEVAEHHIERMRSMWPSGPYHVVGWSLGGQIAHKVAAKLQEKGCEVASLVVIDSYPMQSTHMIDRRLEKQDPAVERLVCAIINREVSQDEDWDAAVNAHFNLDAATHGSLLDTLIKEVNRSITMMDIYTPSHYQGDMLFIEGSGDALRDEAQVPEAWASHVSGEIKVEFVDFAHEALMNPEALVHYAPSVTRHIASIY